MAVRPQDAGDLAIVVAPRGEGHMAQGAAGQLVGPDHLVAGQGHALVLLDRLADLAGNLGLGPPEVRPPRSPPGPSSTRY